MEKMDFEQLEKKYPDEADEFVDEMEMLVIFLNSPNRERWLKALDFPAEKIALVNKIVKHYAKCKIEKENKMKAEDREDIIVVENDCLREIFEGHLLKIKAEDKKAALDAAGKLIESRYPGAAILNERKMAKLAAEAGLKKSFPTDFLVFDAKSMRIYSFGVAMK